MTEFFTIGIVLGLSAGFAPGPLLTLVISETLQHDIKSLPHYNDTTVIAVMLNTIADNLSERVGFPTNNIFMNDRQAHSSMVFDDGNIIQW